MNTATAILDNSYTDHADKVLQSLSEFAPDNHLNYIGHIEYRRDRIDNYKYLTSSLAGNVDAIVLPFSYGDHYATGYVIDGPVLDAFIKGTAVVSAAGNFGDNTLKENQRSVFDFTVGAIQTMEQTEAVFEVADFSNQNPQFVDFYIYGDGGTSYAAPRVAGLIAQIREHDPDASLSAIRTVLEKNSSYECVEPSLTYSPDRDPIEYGSWYIQVLDPYNLKTNLVRDGVKGDRHLVFSKDAPESEYVFDFTFDDTIDTRVRTEALYEVYLNRNPDQEGLDWWVDHIDAGADFLDVIDHFKYFRDNDLDGVTDVSQYEHGAPLIEKIQGLYHAHLARESADQEVITAVQYIESESIKWDEYVAQFEANAYVG